MRRRKKHEKKEWPGLSARSLLLLMVLGSTFDRALRIDGSSDRVVTVMMMSEDMSDNPEAAMDPHPWNPFDFEKDDLHFEHVFWQQQYYDEKNDPMLQLQTAVEIENRRVNNMAPWSKEQHQAYDELMSAQSEYAKADEAWSESWALRGGHSHRAYPQMDRPMDTDPGCSMDPPALDFPDDDTEDEYVEVPMQVLDPTWPGLVPHPRAVPETPETPPKPDAMQLRIGSRSDDEASCSSSPSPWPVPEFHGFEVEVESQPVNNGLAQRGFEIPTPTDHRHHRGGTTQRDTAEEDDAWLVALNIGLTAAQLGELDTATYMALMRRPDLAERQLHALRTVRRRWRNRIAARNSRNRARTDNQRSN